MKATRFLNIILGVVLFFNVSACINNSSTEIAEKNKTDFVFSSAIKEQRNIFQFDLNSNKVTQLIEDSDDNSCPAYSPNGRQIAFCSKQGGKNQLFIAGNDGSNPHVLTDEINGCTCSADAPLSWSPDGKWIALPVLAGDPNQFGYDIFVVDSQGATAQNLTSAPLRYGGLLWDTDSQSILMSGTLGGKSDIYRFNIHTKKYQPLLANSIKGAATSWSADGSQLLLYADSGDGNFDIYLLRKGDNMLTRLTNAPGFDSYPQWFPDGKHILFVSQRDGNHEIYRMNADGSEQLNLTNNPSAMDVWPSISSDGSKIIYLTNANNQWDSWMMNADGSGKTKMTEWLGIPSKIAWKPLNH